MSERIGKIITCDRCGYEEFVLALTDLVMDGGFSRQNRFAKPAEPWGYLEHGKDICPKCLQRYNEKIKEFWEEA